MSSKFHRKNSGKRGAGGDNREQVPVRCSIANQKKRISFLNFLHLFLWILLTARQVTKFWKLSFENSILNLLLTSDSSPWEQVWILGSVFVIILTQISIRRKNLKLFRFSNILIVCFNIVPVIYAIFTQFQKAYILFSNNELVDKYVIIIWYLFLLICVQIHGFALYFCESLLTQWSAGISKKHKK